MAKKPPATGIDEVSPVIAPMVRNATVNVERSILRNRVVVGEPVSEADVIAVHEFVTTPAETGVTVGLTLSIGNFEFARIDVTCKVPCYSEELPQAFEYAMNFAESKLQEQVKEIRASRTTEKPNNHF